MAEASTRDAALMLDIVLAARDAMGFVAGLDEASFALSRLHQNAVIRSLEVIGEAAGKVSRATQETHSAIPWRAMMNMRHRLLHGYADVDLTIVWSIVTEELEPLTAALAPLIPPESAP
jgi:uncharacterized protein with HEPN domain